MPTVARADLNEWDQAFAEADRLTRHNSKTFYFATSLLPRQASVAIRALYAFCRSTDDLVDREGATLADVEAWRSRVALPAAAQPDPALRGWALIREQRIVAQASQHICWDQRCAAGHSSANSTASIPATKAN